MVYLVSECGRHHYPAGLPLQAKAQGIATGIKTGTQPVMQDIQRIINMNSHTFAN
jgi:hypothetical protein